jgi:hypothetical protein
MSPAEEWLRTFYMAATPNQRTILREIVEQLVDCKEIDEVSFARFRRRFGKCSPELRAALDDLEYTQAVERARPPVGLEPLD